MRKLKLLLLLTLLMTVGGGSLNAQDAGTYYIKNVGTGKWLGPGNNWGTQASVLQHADYWKAAKISDGVYTLESVVSNGGKNYYLTGTYCDGGATNFTLTPIAGKENTYSISNAGGGYLTTNGTTVDVSAADGSAEASQWKLYSESDMAAVMAAATVDNPADATYLIKDHDLGRNNRDYSAWSNTGATAPKTNEGSAGTNRYSIEAYQATFDVNQTLSNIPNGVYAIRVNGFYRQDGSNANLPYVYAGDSKTTLPVRTGSENSMQAAAVSFEAGKYLSEPAYVRVDNGTLKIGVKTEGNSCWVIFKNFHLQYYGNVTLAEVLLHEYVILYNAALNAAQDYQDDNMFDADKTALNTAISNNTIDLGGTVTEEMLTTATANLNAAATAAAKAVVKKTAFDNIVTATEGKTDVNITSYIANLGFEDGNLNAWTSVYGGGVATNNNFSGKVGSYFVERWQSGEALGSGSLTHDVITLPTGVYTITANAQNIEQYNNNAAGTGYFFCVNSDQKEIGAANTYTVVVKYTEQTDVTLKFLLDNCTGNWISCDDIQIVYNGEDFPAVTLVEGKMNATVAAAQTAAKEAYDADPTVANYNTLVDAIAAAQASKNAYTDAATAITAANALKEAHNFASAAATTTFAEAIAAINNAYTDNSLTTDAAAAAGTTLGTVVSGWRGNANGAAVKYLNDGFSLNDFDQALYVNTWSTEGENDGSNFKVPFYEYWTGDANSLAKNTWTGTLTNLPNGLYSVSALVRVRAKNETAATDATGITMDVNGGGEGDYAAVDVTEGDQIGESQFQYDTYTAKGLVKDGNLTLNFNVADGNNVSWLCFKNVKYTKVRDLTPEEAAIVPTAIALKVGDDEVTEPIALNATNNTVTLTVNYTPAEATEGVTWESYDENVATVVGGVVTGVAPGTTTIKATSTLDENVNATATVTVTYPETEVVASSYVNDGATRTVVTLGENLIKNGSFEYPNGYYGWKNGSNGDLASANFDIVTDGDNKYLKAKNSEGAGSANSICTLWPIEADKTYVFGYKVKASTTVGDKSKYLVVAMTNSAGDESGKVSKDDETVNTDWNSIEYKFTNTSGYAYVQFRARWLANSLSFDDFYLQEVTDESTEGNVDYATAAIPTANIGTGAFQYSQNAIDAANNLVQGTATVEDVQNAYNALTTINEPSNGQLFNVILTYSGWTYDQKAMTYLANGRNDAGNYNIQYKEAANKNLAQAFTFTKVSGNNYKMSQIDADGNVRYISTGVPYGGNTSQIRTTTDASKALVVTVIPTATEGKWNLRNTEANQFIGSQDAGVYTVNSHIDFSIVETTKPAIAINTTAAGWGTVMLPFAQELPAEVKAYTCEATEDDRLTLKEVVDALEANKPYLIEGAWNEIVTGDAQGIALNYTEGLFTGVYADQDAPVDSYVLQNKKEKLGFYKVAEGKQPTVGSNHAYLTVEAASARDAFFFGEGETTAISMLKALSEGTVEIYNLNGVKQSKLQKGTNILKMSDGSIRKVMVK